MDNIPFALHALIVQATKQFPDDEEAACRWVSEQLRSHPDRQAIVEYLEKREIRRLIESEAERFEAGDDR